MKGKKQFALYAVAVLLMLTLLVAYAAPLAVADRPPPPVGAAVGPTVATIDNGVVHAEIGTNQHNGGPGIIHLWNRQIYPATVPNGPHDVMWYGEYEYVAIDGVWQAMETGGVVTQISPTQASVTWTHATYVLVKNLKTVGALPEVSITFTLTNTDTVAHTYELYYANDFCRGGSGGSANDNLYTLHSTVPLATSQWIPTTVSRALIQEMDVNPNIDLTGEDWAFVATCEEAQFFAGLYSDSILRTWALGRPIVGADDGPGLLYQVGTRGPTGSASASSFIGVTNSHGAADDLAEGVCRPVGGTVSPSLTATILAVLPWLLLALAATGAAAIAMRRRYASPILARIR